MKTIDYYSAIQQKKIKVEVSDEIAKFLDASAKNEVEQDYRKRGFILNTYNDEYTKDDERVFERCLIQEKIDEMRQKQKDFLPEAMKLLDMLQDRIVRKRFFDSVTYIDNRTNKPKTRCKTFEEIAVEIHDAENNERDVLHFLPASKKNNRTCPRSRQFIERMMHDGLNLMREYLEFKELDHLPLVEQLYKTDPFDFFKVKKDDFADFICNFVNHLVA